MVKPDRSEETMIIDENRFPINARAVRGEGLEHRFTSNKDIEFLIITIVMAV